MAPETQKSWRRVAVVALPLLMVIRFVQWMVFVIDSP